MSGTDGHLPRGPLCMSGGVMRQAARLDLSLLSHIIMKIVLERCKPHGRAHAAAVAASTMRAVRNS